MDAKPVAYVQFLEGTPTVLQNSGFMPNAGTDVDLSYRWQYMSRRSRINQRVVDMRNRLSQSSVH